MKKLFIMALAIFALAACGNMGDSHNDDGSYDVYALPEDGYYKETTRYVNGAEVPAGSYEPQYVWVDDTTQTMHYKGDDGLGSYHHSQENFDDHFQGHENHYSGGHSNGHNGGHGYGRSGHGCYNTGYNGYETEGTDDNGNSIRSTFSRISQADYENVVTTN